MSDVDSVTIVFTTGEEATYSDIEVITEGPNAIHLLNMAGVQTMYPIHTLKSVHVVYKEEAQVEEDIVQKH